MADQSWHPFILNNQRLNVEANTFESIAQEATHLFGTDVVYVVREFFQEEEVFGDFLSKISKRGEAMRLFVENIEQFDGGTLYSKFGLSFNDECFVHGPKATFSDKNIVPKPGDLLYHVPSEKLFEVTHVDDDKDGAVFYPLGWNFAYKLSCKLYAHDYSDMEDVPGMESLESLDLQNDIDSNTKNDEIKAIGTGFIDNTENDPING